MKLRFVDVIAASLACLVAVAYLFVLYAEPTWFNAVLGVLSFAFVPALLWLHRSPIRLGIVNLSILGVWAIVCLIVYPHNTGAPPQLLVAPWVVFVIGRTQPASTLSLVVAACMLGSFASPLRWMLHDLGQLGPRPPLNFALMMALHWLMIGVAGLWGRSVQVQQLAAQHEIDRQQERERTLIAAEIHDVLAHSLTLINIQAGAGLMAPDKAQESLENIQQVSTEGIQQVRSIIAALAKRGTTVAESNSLTDLINQFRKQGLIIDAQVVDLSGLPPMIQLALFRLTSECLTNSLKHQHAPIEVSLKIELAESQVTFDYCSKAEIRPATEPGFGLVGLAERCAAVGGTFSHTIGAQVATAHASLPLRSTS